MASYLKNTYIDGNLAIEGALKVGALDLGDTNIPSLTSTATSRLVKTADGNPKQLTQSGMTITESSQITTLTLKAEQTASVQNNNEDQGIQAFNIALLASDLSNNTILSIHEKSTGSPAADQHSFMVCVPCPADTNDHTGELYLWNEAKYQNSQSTADYKWHFTPQPGTAQ